MRFAAVVLFFVVLVSLALAGSIPAFGWWWGLLPPYFGGKSEDLLFFRGQELYKMGIEYRNLSSERCDNAIAAGEFMGYVAAIYDYGLGDKFCASDSVTVGVAADVVVDYLENHPEIRYKGSAVIEALEKTFPFPCKTGSSGKPPMPFFRGQDLYKMSIEYKNVTPERSDNAIEAGKFMGYVAGVHDGVQVDKVCRPKHVTVGMAADVVAKYLQDYPEFRNRLGVEIVVNALQEAFPCEKKKRGYKKRGTGVRP